MPVPELIHQADSEVTQLGHIYHAYLRSGGERRFADQALRLLQQMQRRFSGEADEKDDHHPAGDLRRAS